MKRALTLYDFSLQYHGAPYPQSYFQDCNKWIQSDAGRDKGQVLKQVSNPPPRNGSTPAKHYLCSVGLLVSIGVEKCQVSNANQIFDTSPGAHSDVSGSPHLC